MEAREYDNDSILLQNINNEDFKFEDISLDTVFKELKREECNFSLRD